MNQKIIFLDCDGTIFDVPRGMPTASKYTKYAISELIKNGHLVFIASGRNQCLLPEDVVDLKPSGFITTNGAYAYIGDKVIVDMPMKQEDIDEVSAYCELTGGVCYFEPQDIIEVQNMHTIIHQEFVDTWGVPHRLFEDGRSNKPCYLIMTAFENEKDCVAFELNLSSKVDVRKQYGFTSFDVSSKGMDKGVGVLKVLEYLNMSKEDAYAFGDGLNDAEMLLAVKHSYAMENGDEKIKALASDIAPDVLDEGFYKVMLQEGLIKPLEE